MAAHPDEVGCDVLTLKQQVRREKARLELRTSLAEELHRIRAGLGDADPLVAFAERALEGQTEAPMRSALAAIAARIDAEAEGWGEFELGSELLGEVCWPVREGSRERMLYRVPVANSQLGYARLIDVLPFLQAKEAMKALEFLSFIERLMVPNREPLEEVYLLFDVRAGWHPRYRPDLEPSVRFLGLAGLKHLVGRIPSPADPPAGPDAAAGEHGEVDDGQ